jgi:energy-coupling factor transporter transmembrane protein EcfT
VSARLSARAWLIWSLAAVAVALSTDNPVYRGLVAAAALNVLIAWLPGGRSLRPLAFGLAFAVFFAVLVNGLAGHGGADTIVSVPEAVPIFGGAITIESLLFGCSVGLGLVAALLAVAPLSMVLETHEVIDAIPARLERTGIAVATSLNLISGIGSTFRAVREAQTMRGWRPRGIGSWREVLVPVVLTAIEDSATLAEAMEARAFGAARRTSYAVVGWSGRDVLVGATAVASFAAFVALRLSGYDPDWYPYPTPYLPTVQPVLVVACLTLALPALLAPARGGLRQEAQA